MNILEYSAKLLEHSLRVLTENHENNFNRMPRACYAIRVPCGPLFEENVPALRFGVSGTVNSRSVWYFIWWASFGGLHLG